MKKTFVKGEIKKCCKNPDNLERQPSKRPDAYVMKCKVCGCNHYKLICEPGIFGVIGKNLGR